MLGGSYFGHDATVRLGLPHGEEVLARVVGSVLPPRGTALRLVVRGPVRVYPAME